MQENGGRGLPKSSGTGQSRAVLVPWNRGAVNGCPHPADQQVRSVYYLLCGACKQVRLVSYCNYSKECHPDCALAAVCVQEARARYHAAVPLQVESGLQ